MEEQEVALQTGLQPGTDGYYHPASEDEVVQLIQQARSQGKQVRVRGSAHSVAAAIYTTGFKPGNPDPRNINIILDRLSKIIEIDKEKKQVTVQAGCHLGKDPFDPTGTSTVHNSLFYQINKAGLAFPDTGGISHQTAAGFTATGSSGGSLMDDVAKQIVGIRLVDGTGTVHELTEEGDADRFHAAAVSMGLLGVVTQMTFQCVDSFHIIGTQSTTTVADCPIDLFNSGGNDLESYFRKTDFSRLLWWPQQGVEKMVIWEAKKMGPSDYNEQTGTPDNFHRKPYEEFPPILGSELPAEVAASLFYTLIGRWPDWLYDLLGNGPEYELLKNVLEGLFAPVILPAVVNAFVPVDGPEGPQQFWDTWWQGLPMDNAVNDRIMPTEFTEIWLPIEQTAEAMTALRDHFAAGGLAATGTYSTELYAAKQNNYWMSPSYQRDVFRVDIFWFTYNKGNPAEVFYPQFWELLKPFDYRLHWGKYLSGDVDYLRKNYPKWDAWMALRSEMDPDGVFLTEYWKKNLGI